LDAVLLIVGLLLFAGVHLFRRTMPAKRAEIADLLGGEGPARGAIALLLVLAIVLMVVGYQRMPYIHVFTPPAWTIHVNNLLMLVAFALIGMGHSKGRSRSWFRHPMLMGVTVWAFAHVIVNGHLAALILFLGLAAWANVHMALINATEPDWKRPEPGGIGGDLVLIAITLVLFTVTAAIHAWLGVWPFPR
jgi:uncharacterized membrane protein